MYTLPFNRPPKERSRQALDRLPLVSNFLTNFWMKHFDGARLSPNSVRNAIWHTLNEPVCQYLRRRNPRCSTVYIDNSLGPLARDSSCIILPSTLKSAQVYISFRSSNRKLLIFPMHSTRHAHHIPSNFITQLTCRGAHMKFHLYLIFFNFHLILILKVQIVSTFAVSFVFTCLMTLVIKV